YAFLAHWLPRPVAFERAMAQRSPSARRSGILPYVPTTNDPQPGLVLAERYRLERELGRGGMGSVWRATHLTLRSHVAIKLLSAKVSIKDAESRFLQEARAAARLNNPHVVHLSDFGVHEGLPFLVMELLEGETLATRLSREGRLTPAVTALVFAQLGRG